MADFNYRQLFLIEVKALQDFIKQIRSSVKDAKVEYDRTCSDLTHFLDTKSNHSVSAGVSTDENSSVEVVGPFHSSDKATFEMNSGEQVASLSKNAAKSATKKQEEELDKLIQNVLMAEKNYLQSVQFFNSESSALKFDFERKNTSFNNLKKENQEFMENIFLPNNQDVLKQAIQIKEQVAIISDHLLREIREGVHHNLDTESDSDTIHTSTRPKSYESIQNDEEDDNNLQQLVEDEHQLELCTNALFWSIQQAQQLSVQSRGQLELLLNTLRQCNAVNTRSSKSLDDVAEKMSHPMYGSNDSPNDTVNRTLLSSSRSSESAPPRWPKDQYQSGLNGLVLSYLRGWREVLMVGSIAELKFFRDINLFICSGFPAHFIRIDYLGSCQFET